MAAPSGSPLGKGQGVGGLWLRAGSGAVFGQHHPVLALAVAQPFLGTLGIHPRVQPHPTWAGTGEQSLFLLWFPGTGACAELGAWKASAGTPHLPALLLLVASTVSLIPPQGARAVLSLIWLQRGQCNMRIYGLFHSLAGQDWWPVLVQTPGLGWALDTVSCLPLGFGSVSSCPGQFAVTGGFGPSVQARHDLNNIHGHSFGACARPEPLWWAGCGALTSRGLSLHRAPSQLQPVLDGNRSPCVLPQAGVGANPARQ